MIILTSHADDGLTFNYQRFNFLFYIFNTERLFNYIIGLAGSDYVTIDGLSLQESASNISTATTTVFTELGIALFKQQVGTATIGANGCQHNLIQNNSIGLDRRGNATFATLMNGGYGQVLPGY